MNYFFLILTFSYCVASNAQTNYDGYQPQAPIDPVDIALSQLQQNIDDAVERIEHNEVTVLELKKLMQELQIALEQVKDAVAKQDNSFDYRVKYLIACYLHDHAKVSENTTGTLTMPLSFFEYIFSLFKKSKQAQTSSLEAV